MPLSVLSKIVTGRPAGDLSGHFAGARVYANPDGVQIARLANTLPCPFFINPNGGVRFLQLFETPLQATYRPDGTVQRGTFHCTAAGMEPVVLKINDDHLSLLTPDAVSLVMLEPSAAEQILLGAFFRFLPKPHRVVYEFETEEDGGLRFMLALPEGEEDWQQVRILQKRGGKTEEVTAIEVDLHNFGVPGRDPGVIIHTLTGSFYLQNIEEPRHRFEQPDRRRFSLRALTTDHPSMPL